jgi:hypothetical protein
MEIWGPTKMESAVNTLRKQVSFRDLAKEIPSTTYGTFGLYGYPAKFIPQVIAYVLNEYAKTGMTVFDPFAGYGTTGVVSSVYGHDYELWDLNPLLATLHKVATMKQPKQDVAGLLSEMRLSNHEFIPDWSNCSYWFPEAFLPFLFKVWGFYHSLKDEEAKLLLTIPLLKITRIFSYDDIQRQKLSKSPKSRKRVRRLLKDNWQEIFYERVEEETCAIIKGVAEHHALSPEPVESVVRAGVDTLTIDLSEEMDILITSPPYLQAQEYIRHAKMDLFWLDYPESLIRELGKKEIPYRDVEPCEIKSDIYHTMRKQIEEEHLLKIFDVYFWGVLGALTRLQEKISSYLFLFVGPATLRGRPVPIDDIFLQHFTALGWTHEVTLVDTIVARRMFFYNNNPATGLKDKRMRTESLVVLRR